VGLGLGQLGAVLDICIHIHMCICVYIYMYLVRVALGAIIHFLLGDGRLPPSQILFMKLSAERKVHPFRINEF